MRMGAEELFGRERFARTRDGRALQYMIAESRVGPVVVFESGLGGAIRSGRSFNPSVSEFAGTVVHNRAGYGRSDPAKGAPPSTAWQTISLTSWPTYQCLNHMLTGSSW